MIEREQLTPLNNPEGQEELFTSGKPELREGTGEAKPWIIPVKSTANIAGSSPDVETQVELPPCAPSEAEKILRKNINSIITQFLDKQSHGNKQAHQRMLYRRMRLVCEKPVKDMNQSDLEKVWLWVKREYGGQK
jgi:hypothetical protein